MGDLILSAKCTGFREEKDLDNSIKFQEVKKFIHARDGNACGYCKDVFDNEQEIHHKDGDHHNDDKDNLETICPLCHTCLHINVAGERSRGIIAYLPELTQVEINSSYKMLMCIAEQDELHLLSKFAIQAEPWCILSAGFSNVKGMPNIIGEKIQSRVDIVENRFCKGWSNPSVFGTMLLSLENDAYSKRKEALKGLRLIPSIQGYASEAKAWRDYFLKTKPLSSWSDIADAVVKNGAY